MQSTDAKRVVVLGMTVVGAITVVSYARKGTMPPLRVGIGTVGSMAILAMIAGPAPDIAAGLTGITVLGSLMGSPILGAITDALGKPVGAIRALPMGAVGGGLLAGFKSSTSPSSSLTGDDPVKTISGGLWGTIDASQAAAIIPTLVPIGYGSHKLEPGAASKYKSAVALLGGAIPVTDSWRSYQVQAAGHAAQPGRFAAAGTSAHVRGKAIDIVKMNDGATKAALIGAGWTQARPSDEPWHYCSDGAH